jgi:hypothetical protein
VDASGAFEAAEGDVISGCGVLDHAVVGDQPQRAVVQLLTLISTQAVRRLPSSLSNSKVKTVSRDDDRKGLLAAATEARHDRYRPSCIAQAPPLARYRRPPPSGGIRERRPSSSSLARCDWADHEHAVVARWNTLARLARGGMAPADRLRGAMLAPRLADSGSCSRAEERAVSAASSGETSSLVAAGSGCRRSCVPGVRSGSPCAYELTC